MKKTNCLLSCLMTALLTAPLVHADTIARWTFEINQPSGAPAAGVWITNLIAETGNGVASGWHAGGATYSSVTGNGSAKAFSVNDWTANDFFQFCASTIGFQNVTVSYDQTGSPTGPRDFIFSYSIDGVTFTAVGSPYVVLTNGTSSSNEGTGKSTSAWSATGSHQIVYTQTFDLSSFVALNNQPTLYFRLTVADGTAGNGSAIGTTGTDRVDNFLVSGTSLPLLNLQLAGTNTIVTWNDSSFALQAAPEMTGTFTNVAGASSPYTNGLDGPARFYRLTK